jgi:sugar lactone lactonase YvrE
MEPDGSVSVAADGLLFPNGWVITPDGATLIVVESWGQRLTAFDLEADGSLVNRRDWAGFGPPQATGTPGQPAQWSCAPDGITLDAEGAVWVADAANKRACGCARAGRSSRSSGPATWTSSPAPWAATTGKRCSVRHPRLPAPAAGGGQEPAGPHP